jgi:hypothetical protein
MTSGRGEFSRLLVQWDSRWWNFSIDQNISRVLLFRAMHVYDLTTLSVTQTLLSNDWVTETINRKGCRRKRSWLNLRYDLDICFEGLRKPTKNFSQRNRCPDRGSNWTPPGYKTEALSLEPSRPVRAYLTVWCTLLLRAQYLRKKQFLRRGSINRAKSRMIAISRHWK